MPGLDPGIVTDDAARRSSGGRHDCRVKPGNDEKVSERGRSLR